MLSVAKRTEKIGIRATKAIRAAWEAAARADGRTLTSWIEHRCNGGQTTSPTMPVTSD